MVKIRMARYGRHKLPFYRIVAVDSRVKRDGAYIELLGTYDPLKNKVNLRIDAIKKWLDFGAQPSDTVKSFLRKEKVWSQFAIKNKPKKKSKTVHTKNKKTKPKTQKTKKQKKVTVAETKLEIKANQTKVSHEKEFDSKEIHPK